MDLEARRQHNRADFVLAALAIVDRDGLEKLTTRSLGLEVAADSTAVYRHFPNMNALWDAVFDHVLSLALLDAPEDAAPADEELLKIMCSVRSALAQHPRVVSLAAASSGLLPHGVELSKRVISLLRALGLTHENVIVAYQLIESFTIGSTVFDFGGAPESDSIRAARYRVFGYPEFTDVSKDSERVAKKTQQAFETGASLIVQHCKNLAGQ